MAKKDLKKNIKSKDSGEDVLYDLKDDVQAYIDDGYDLEDAITEAIDSVYKTQDIIDLGLHYGVIDDRQILQDCYEDLYNDLSNGDYVFPNWYFVVTDNNLGLEHESDADYVDEQEAEDAAYDFVEEIRDSIEVREEDGEFVAYVTFDNREYEVARMDDEDGAYSMANAWVNELDYKAERA